MNRGLYDEIRSEDQVGARRREYEALAKVVDLLQEANGKSIVDTGLARALDLLDALWSIFIDDLAGSGNMLPDDLRARLISIGLWVTRTSTEVRLAGGGDLGALIDVNAAIRDGLRH